MCQAFQIFRLPSLPLEVVFGQMTVGEIVNLSKCSKRSQATMKLFLPNSLYHIIRKWLDSRSKLKKMYLHFIGGIVLIGDILREIPYKKVDGEYVIRREDGFEARISCRDTQFKMFIS